MRLAVPRRAICLAAVLAVAAGTVPAVAGGAPVRRSQELASLLNSHKAIRALDARGAPGVVVHPTRPITGGPTVLPVLRHATTKDGVRWLQVRVPGRPNSRTGWIARRGTMLSTTTWQLVVKTSSRRVLVYRRGRFVRAFPAIVGKPSTPTPHGQFFVEESVQTGSGAVGGPFALALSARSNVLQEFEGGPGQIALHGLANLGGTLGTAASHGCVRLANGSIGWLAARIPPGVPVRITS
jgi:lipoprotein-anchoring transpeptidase ErfK/SrfK